MGAPYRRAEHNDVENWWTCTACGAEGVLEDRHEDAVLTKEGDAKMGCSWAYKLELAAVRPGSPADACGIGKYIGWRLAAVNGRPVSTLQDVSEAAAAATSLTLLFNLPRHVTCPMCCASRTPTCPECRTPLGPSGRCIVQTCSRCPPPNPANAGQVDGCLVQ
eukprot:TRINITY_DN10921_c0_g1_i1.p2 TRINITY_DN10921_c0_g1~~TRINITY_DN10921_c0_g1_i1.p2  ORF type:complete len:163 (+),score=29.46 TRINITY_DN10921_c0_g1_i1:70-558(+)